MHKNTNGGHVSYQHFSIKNCLTLCWHGTWQASTLYWWHPHFSRKNIQRTSHTFGGDSHMFREGQFLGQRRQELILQQGTWISWLCFNPQKISANAKAHQSNTGHLGPNEHQRRETFSWSLWLYQEPHSRAKQRSWNLLITRLTKKDVKFA